jgi:hypothetical protein
MIDRRSLDQDVTGKPKIVGDTAAAIEKSGEPQNVQPSHLMPGAFDYGSVKSDVAMLARRTAKKFRAYQQRNVAEVIRLGKDFLRVKKALGHGKFTAWVAAEFPGHQRTVERCILTAKFEGKIDTVSNLPLSTVYLLAAPSTPKALREEALTRSENGEIIDQHALRAEINRVRLRCRRPRPINAKEQQQTECAQARAQELLEEFGLPTIKRLLEAFDDRRVLAALRKAIG